MAAPARARVRGVTLGGGVHQRRLRDQERFSVPPIKSTLAESLMHDCAWGMISPQKAQSIAAMALADMEQVLASNPNANRSDFAELELLEALRNLGSRGRYPQNCSRDFFALANTSNGEIPSQEIPVPLKVGNAARPVVWTPLSFLLPQVMFAWIFANCAKTWKKRICPGRNTLRRFWESQAEHPSMRSHPMRAVPGWKTRAVPVALHGDAVPVTGCGKAWSKSMLAISWCSLLGKGQTLAFNFLITAFFTALAFTGFGPLNTNARAYAIIRWSLYWLYRGEWPTHDCDNIPILDARAGTPLAAGFFGVLWVIKGDLEHYAHVLRNWPALR